MKINISEVERKPHPKFAGVKIGFIATKDKTKEMSITVLEIAAGVEIPAHTHEREVDSIFVLEGEGEIYFSDNWYPLKIGDVVIVKPGEVHGIRNTGKHPLICYIVHAPALW